VNETDLLFSYFHRVVSSAVKMLSAAMYCEGNAYCVSQYHLNKWHQCKFSGEESFPDVRHAFGNHSIGSLGDYIAFIGNIPMITNLIGVRHFSSVHCYIIMFFMTMDAFTEYINHNYVFVDQLINMCGFYPNSIDICDRCADNANNVDSTKTHALDCPYYQSLFPEAQVGNLMPPDPYFLFRSVTSNTLCEDDIAEMYNAALSDPILTTGKKWTLPIAHISTFNKVAKNDRYLLAEFRNNRDGTLFTKWLTRNEAVKVIHFCYFVCPFKFFLLLLHHFFSTFVHFSIARAVV